MGRGPDLRGALLGLVKIALLVLLFQLARAEVQPMQPLVEASGAVHGELIAGGKFCSPAPSGSEARPVLAVLEDSVSLTVSLLAGPTPYLVRRLTPTSPNIGRFGSGITSVAALSAVDLDQDGRDELVIGTRAGRLLVLAFSVDCSSVSVASKPLDIRCEALPCSLAALLPVPLTMAPAGLVAVQASGAVQPFVLLGQAAGEPLQLTGNTSSDFGFAKRSQRWIAAAASANRSQLLVVHAEGAVSLAVDGGKVSLIAQRNLSAAPAAGCRSCGVVDFAGDGRNVAVLVDGSTSPHATMLSMPSLRLLGGGDRPRQAMDTNYSWSSVAVASLSDAYGASSSGWRQTKGMQQLVGLRVFPQLHSCPSYRGHAFGDNTSGIFCCRTNENNSCLSGNWSFGGDASQPADRPCCLRPGTLRGCGYGEVNAGSSSGGCTEMHCAQAPPCGVAATLALASGRAPQFVVSMLVFGDGALWAPRRSAMAQSMISQDSVDYTENFFEVMKQGLNETRTTVWASGVCDLIGKNTTRYPGCTQAGTGCTATYDMFVEALVATEGFLIGGRQQLRMWLILGPPFESKQCGPPTDSLLTPWNETALFTRPDGTLAESWSHYGTLAWGELMGRLASRWPHLVGWNCDDMSQNIEGFPEPLLAATTARIRQYAPWFSFAPTIYYRPPGFTPNNYAPDGTLQFSSFEANPDLPLVVDAPVLFFRDEKNSKRADSPCRQDGCPWPHPTRPDYTGCLAGWCADSTTYNVAAEVADMVSFVPTNRQVHVGFYLTGHGSLGATTPLYVREVMSTILAQPRTAGIVVYTTRFPESPGVCRLKQPPLYGGDRGCIVAEMFGNELGY